MINLLISFPIFLYIAILILLFTKSNNFLFVESKALVSKLFNLSNKVLKTSIWFSTFKISGLVPSVNSEQRLLNSSNFSNVSDLFSEYVLKLYKQSIIDFFNLSKKFNTGTVFVIIYSSKFLL